MTGEGWEGLDEYELGPARLSQEIKRCSRAGSFCTSAFDVVHISMDRNSGTYIIGLWSSC